MSVSIGISLIAWQNDDLPDLTADFTTEGAMEDAARIGYRGVERGRRMPAETEAKRFASEEPTRRTVEVEQFCSWSACRISSRSSALTISGSSSYGSAAVPKHRRRKFSTMFIELSGYSRA